MRCKKCFTLFWFLAFGFYVQAQCLSGDSLWNRIVQYKNAEIPIDSQLQKLLDLNTQVNRCRVSKDSSDAFLLQRIGSMYFGKGDFQSSLRYTVRALDLLHYLQKNNYINPVQKIKCFWNLSIMYDSLHDAGKKNEVIDSCISIGLQNKVSDMLLLYALEEKINWLLNIGEYTRCIEYASLSQNLAEKYGYLHSDVFMMIFTLKIDALLLLNNNTEALFELRNKIHEYKQNQTDDNSGGIYRQLAGYFVAVGNIDSALYSYKKSFQYDLKYKFDKGCSSSLNSIGFLYFEFLGDYPKALDYYFRALRYSDANESISILSNIANVYTRRNLFDSAFYYYQKAFDQLRPGLNESLLLNSRNDITGNKLVEYLVSLILDKADAHLVRYKKTKRQDQLDQTIASYKTADLLLDKIKQDQYEMQSKLFWRNSTRRLYEHAIEACWMGQNTNQGFYFFEKSRAVLLDDKLREDHFLQNQYRDEQYQLKKELNDLENELDTTNLHSEQYSIIQTDIISKKQAQDLLLLKTKSKDPLYAARNLNREEINIQHIQDSVLNDHSGLLEIFNGDSSLFTLRITNAAAGIAKIDKKLFDSLTRLYTAYISDPTFLNGHFSTFRNTSLSLYKLIFSDQPLPAGRIIISPDGNYFPFESLISDDGPDPHYMLKDYAISYTYSARFLLNRINTGPERKIIDFMGMAPVNYASYMNLSPLQGSDVSLQKIQSHFSNVFTLLNSAATKNNFLENFANYKIVQLYSHASYSDSTGKPVIYFSDSSLDLSELFSRESPAARLVVLSACETALGTDYKGEGVFSFSREFASLGIPASVSNLWSVDNEATYRITENFYQFISDGLPTDIAMQKAKLKFMQEASTEKKLPFYWASAILTGKTETIKTKPAFPFRYLILLFAITGILLLIYFRWKK